MGTKWLFDHGQYRTQYIQERSSQKSSSDQSLVLHRNREVRAESGVYVASRPTTHITSQPFSLLRLMVQKSHGEEASVGRQGARALRRHASNKRVCTTSGSTCGASSLNFSKFNAHCEYGERGQRDREGRSPRRGRHRYSQTCVHPPNVEGFT